MDIREAQVEDAPIILKIQKEAYISEAKLHNDFQIPPLTQTLSELEAEFGKRRIIKAVIDGRIIGSGQAKLVDSTCHIARLSVKNNFKGKGIGSKLLAELESSFAEAKRVELFTGINSVANLAMYSRRGYKKLKQEKLAGTTVVFMEKQV